MGGDQNPQWIHHSGSQLLQLCVFRFDLFEDGDVRVSVFPQREEILIRGDGFRLVRRGVGALCRSRGGRGLHCVSATQPEVGQRYVKARGVLEDADKFDAAFFGLNPKEAEVLDPQHRVFLECAWEALENAGCDQADLLAHLRGPGPHVRGCWAVDLLLGKA